MSWARLQQGEQDSFFLSLSRRITAITTWGLWCLILLLSVCVCVHAWAHGCVPTRAATLRGAEGQGRRVGCG
jgi:hypothetical protein